MNINDILHFDYESVLSGMGPAAMVLVCLIVIAETGLFVGVSCQVETHFYLLLE